jgi:hypothetical protein
MIFVATKNSRTNKISPSSFGAVVGSGIWDTGSDMDKNPDPGSGINILDPQHCSYDDNIGRTRNDVRVGIWGNNLNLD